MSLYDSTGVLAVIPARNEERDIAAAVTSVLQQTHRPSRIVVVVNNSNDRTEQIAHSFVPYGVHVLTMEHNPHLKAGALNAGIEAMLDSRGQLPPDIGYVLTMDGDTILERDFIENCLVVMRAQQRVGGVSAACLGRRRLGETRWERTLTLFQEIEYARHHAARFRRNVHTMSGAGSFYRAAAAQDILNDRGMLFREDAGNLVEDYETTLELKEHGWRVTSNYHCVAHTDLMMTLGQLIKQRTRWICGTVDELRRRGLRKSTWSSIAALFIGTVGTLLVMGWSAWNIQRIISLGGGFDPKTLLIWGAAWPMYQAWLVRRLGWRAITVELLVVPELIFGVLRQYWLYKSIALSYFNTHRSWT